MSKLPRILIDLAKLVHNFKALQARCAQAEIALNTVVKGVAGAPRVVAALWEAGMVEVGDSRLENLRSYPALPGLNRVKLRLPSLTTAAATVEWSDVSLNAELLTLQALNHFAGEQRRRHRVILMVDQGDLREGVSEADLAPLALGCRPLSHLEVVGLGTNFSCFAGVMPTPEALARLVELAAQLRSEFNLPIRLVSGGNSSSLPLLYNGTLPPGVNHLRIGEGILLGRETLHGTQLPDLLGDAFVVEAEVIQVQWKAARPTGQVGLDAFGRIPELPEGEPGIRLLLNLGEQDTPLHGLTPLDPGFRVLGGSSDYLVLASERPCRVGQTIRFLPNYWSLLSLMTSPYVTQEYRINYW